MELGVDEVRGRCRRRVNGSLLGDWGKSKVILELQLWVSSWDDWNLKKHLSVKNCYEENYDDDVVGETLILLYAGHLTYQELSLNTIMSMY